MDHGLSTSEVQQATLAFRALHRHHGELVLHRLEEMIGDTKQALRNVPEDHPHAARLRWQHGPRLRMFGHMVDVAEAAGVTGEVT